MEGKYEYVTLPVLTVSDVEGLVDAGQEGLVVGTAPQPVTRFVIPDWLAFALRYTEQGDTEERFYGRCCSYYGGQEILDFATASLLEIFEDPRMKVFHQYVVMLMICIDSRRQIALELPIKVLGEYLFGNGSFGDQEQLTSLRSFWRRCHDAANFVFIALTQKNFSTADEAFIMLQERVMKIDAMPLECQCSWLLNPLATVMLGECSNSLLGLTIRNTDFRCSERTNRLIRNVTSEFIRQIKGDAICFVRGDYRFRGEFRGANFFYCDLADTRLLHQDSLCSTRLHECRVRANLAGVVFQVLTSPLIYASVSFSAERRLMLRDKVEVVYCSVPGSLEATSDYEDWKDSYNHLAHPDDMIMHGTMQGMRVFIRVPSIKKMHNIRFYYRFPDETVWQDEEGKECPEKYFSSDRRTPPSMDNRRALTKNDCEGYDQFSSTVHMLGDRDLRIARRVGAYRVGYVGTGLTSGPVQFFPQDENGICVAYEKAEDSNLDWGAFFGFSTPDQRAFVTRFLELPELSGRFDLSVSNITRDTNAHFGPLQEASSHQRTKFSATLLTFNSIYGLKIMHNMPYSYGSRCAGYYNRGQCLAEQGYELETSCHGKFLIERHPSFTSWDLKTSVSEMVEELRGMDYSVESEEVHIVRDGRFELVSGDRPVLEAFWRIFFRLDGGVLRAYAIDNGAQRPGYRGTTKEYIRTQVRAFCHVLSSVQYSRIVDKQTRGDLPPNFLKQRTFRRWCHVVDHLPSEW